MSAQLIPISQVVSLAKSHGINLGHGDSEEHIFYLSKLGLLPKASKKRVEGRIKGHYPDWVIERLQKITDLKKKGLSYSQMKFYLTETDYSTSPLSQTPNVALTSNNLVILVIGLILGYLLSQNSLSPRPNVPESSASLSDQNLQELVRSTVRALNQPAEDERVTIYSVSLPENSLKFLPKTDLDLKVNP